MRILIATDAWRPQVNGVLHTLEANAQVAKALGAEVVFLNPEGFPSVGMPSYPGIRANRRPFTTSFHTRFTDYAAARFPVPQGWTWAWLRWLQPPICAMISIV